MIWISMNDIQDYLEQGKNNIERMQLEYMFSPYKDVFIRTDLGLLEEMFAGYGGEFLYRPFEKNYSIGFSAHRVYQSEYKQRFGLLGYETDTGHLTLYYDFPYGIASQFSMGKYLAGDKGVTLDLSRRFDSGVIVGVFASKTNLSSVIYTSDIELIGKYYQENRTNSSYNDLSDWLIKALVSTEDER